MNDYISLRGLTRKERKEINRIVRKQRREKRMNAKQSLKLARKHIEELEYYKQEATADIKAYNGCIEHMIKGGSPCDWCNDQVECQLQAKEDGKGCDEWMLKFRDTVPDQDADGGNADANKRILPAGEICGK